MRALIGTSVILGLLAGAAWAQAPGAPLPPPGPAPQPAPYAPPPYGAPQPYPPPAPQPYGPSPYAPPVYAPVPLTAEEQELLARGEISDGQHLGGGLAAMFVGFGVGQAVQGRWSDTGWIFTLGEGLSFGAMMWGIGQAFEECGYYDDCRSDSGVGLVIAGALGYSVFRIWGAVDAFTGPASHNRRVRELRMRTGHPGYPGYYSVLPYVTAPRDGDGAVGGLTLRF